MNSRFEDEDIKIAPEDLSKLFEKENPVADDNIDLFIQQRSLGNTERARRLGAQYVADLLDCVWTKPPAGIDAGRFELQLRLLFAYVVHRIVEDYSPNHIVAQSVLSSFYEQLEEADRAVFDSINDDPAFTLYLYLHRSRGESAPAVGKQFARLCGAEESADCAVIGESGYARYLGACAQRMLSAEFRQ